MKKLILTLTVLAFAFTAQAQTKIGYTNVEYLLSYLPETKGVSQEIADYQSQLEAQIKSQTEAFQKKVTDYQQTAGTMTDVARKATEKELQAEDARIRKMTSDSEANFVNKRNTLLAPLYAKVMKAVQEVRKANGYSHIFTASIGQNAVLIDADENSDISDLVFTQLGIDPAAVKKEQAALSSKAGGK